MDHPHTAISSQSSPAKSPEARTLVVWHLVLGIVVSLAAFGAFMGIADWVEDGASGEVRFDRAILLWLHHHQMPGLTELAKALAIMGSPPVIIGIGVVATIFGFVYRHVRGAAWTIPTAIVGSGIIIQGVKLFVHRARPDLFKPLLHESGYSFPSGHSMIAVVVYGLLGYFAMRFARSVVAKRAIVSVTILVILLIGISRPYVGVHYPTDVLAGWAVGIPWLITCMGLHEVLSRHFARAGEPVLNQPPPISRALEKRSDI